MHSPSALTEHVSLNLAGIFLLDPVQGSTKKWAPGFVDAAGEVVSNSSNKIHQIWGPPFTQALYLYKISFESSQYVFSDENMKVTCVRMEPATLLEFSGKVIKS